jgi:hypothetical protein
VETHSGEDLIIVGYLGGDTVVPDPDTVSAFTARLLAGDADLRPGTPPAIRSCRTHADLAALFRLPATALSAA